MIASVPLVANNHVDAVKLKLRGTDGCCDAYQQHTVGELRKGCNRRLANTHTDADLVPSPFWSIYEKIRCLQIVNRQL